MLGDLYKNQSKHNEKTQDSSRLQSPKAGWKKSESLPVSLSLLSHRRLSCNIWNTHRSQPACSYFRPCKKRNEPSVNHDDLCERECKPWNSKEWMDREYWGYITLHDCLIHVTLFCIGSGSRLLLSHQCLRRWWARRAWHHENLLGSQCVRFFSMTFFHPQKLNLCPDTLIPSTCCKVNTLLSPKKSWIFFHT